MRSGLIIGSFGATIRLFACRGPGRDRLVVVVGPCVVVSIIRRGVAIRRCDVVVVIRQIVIREDGRPVHGIPVASLSADGVDCAWATVGECRTDGGRVAVESCGFFVFVVAGERA